MPSSVVRVDFEWLKYNDTWMSPVPILLPTSNRNKTIFRG